jgi:hypothetical protein
MAILYILRLANLIIWCQVIFGLGQDIEGALPIVSYLFAVEPKK